VKFTFPQTSKIVGNRVSKNWRCGLLNAPFWPIGLVEYP